MMNLDKLTAHFDKPYAGTDEVGALYVSRQAQAFYATKEKQAREECNLIHAKTIIKATKKVEADGKAVQSPLVFTDLFSLGLVTKLDDSKVDNKLLLANICETFKCSEARAKEVIDRSKVRPIKNSLVIQRLV